MCQCFQGPEINWENLRTPEQQKMMASLYPIIMGAMKEGATPYPGQLSAPMTDAQKMAMKTMSGIGGYGWEQQSPRYRSVPSMPIPDVPPMPGGFDDGGADASSQYVPPGGGVPPANDPIVEIINEIINRGGGYTPFNPGGGGGRERRDRERRKRE